MPPPRAPALADGCRHVYLDLGSNNGVQIRKLFQGDLYPGSAVLHLFRNAFGNETERRNMGLCAFGFEANPKHETRLRLLEEAYRAQGWNTTFFRSTAVTLNDSVMDFFTHDSVVDNIHEDYKASLNPLAGGKRRLVKTVDIRRFLREHIIPRRVPPGGGPWGPAVVTKMDIEGEEWAVLPALFSDPTLACGIGATYIEWHMDVSTMMKYNVSHATRGALERRATEIRNSTKGCQLALIDMDDESYSHDGRPFPDGRVVPTLFSAARGRARGKCKSGKKCKPF